MSEIIIVRRRMPVRRAFRFLCVFVSAQVIALSALAATDDSFLFLLSHTNTVGSLVTKVIQQVTDAIGITTSNSSGGTSGSSGSFDRALINAMEDGYAKDYLKICLENEKGELDTTARTYYVSTATIIGINISETKYYGTGDGVTLPNSDIPSDLLKKGTYGNGNISLYKWSNSTATSHRTEIGGAFAYTPSTGKWTGINTKSKYNTGSSTPGGKGDAYLMPDAVCGLNTFAAKGMSELKIDSIDSISYSDTAASIITAFTHNTGSGLLNALYGACHFGGGNTYNADDTETRRRLNILAKDITSGTNSLSDTNRDKVLKLLGDTPWVESEFCLLTQGWQMSQEMYDHVFAAGHSLTTAWNCYFPNDKVNSESELRIKLKAYVTSVSKLTGLSVSECDKTYAIENGSYSKAVYDRGYHSQALYGTMFKIVGDNETHLKGKKGMPQIIAMPGIPLQHVYTASAFGDAVARKMMIYAGVSPDLANKITGSNDSANNSEENINFGSVSFKANSKTLETLKSHGCDISKLDNARYHVLAAAVKMDGKSIYTWGGAHDRQGCTDLTHSGYDCSSFVKHAVQGSGIEELKNVIMPGSTSEYASNSSLNSVKASTVEKEKWYPADILWHSNGSHGHTMLFVGFKSGKVQTLEAMGSNSPTNGWHERSSVSADYHIARIKKYYVVDSF